MRGRPTKPIQERRNERWPEETPRMLCRAKKKKRARGGKKNKGFDGKPSKLTRGGGKENFDDLRDKNKNKRRKGEKILSEGKDGKVPSFLRGQVC